MTGPDGDGCFPTTSWTLIARLRSGDETTARRALEDLCAQYRYPLYCAIRYRGLAHHDAEDALHGFLAKLLRLDAFADADAEKGRLRAFLCAALGRYLLNWRRDHASRALEVSLDAPDPDASISEKRYQKERFPDHETPEVIFHRQWARELLARVLTLLAARYASRGKSAVFQALRPVLQAGGSLRGEETTNLAAALGLSAGALRVAHHRFLKDYRALLEAEVFQTVSSPEDVRQEIADLQAAFRTR